MADVARAAGVSRPLVSRILHGDPAVTPDYLYARLEKSLGKLVDMRTKAFFPIEAVGLDVVQGAAAKVRKPVVNTGNEAPIEITAEGVARITTS